MPATTTESRRKLHFDTIAESLADVDQIAAAHQAATLRAIGQWTPGKILGHLATWVDYCFDGAPLEVPFWIAMLVRPMKRIILYKPMRTGTRIPGVPGGTLALDDLPFDEALSKFRKNFSRLASEAPAKPHMVFGPLTHDEWINFNLRHAELHLSFLRWD